jgi:hypothetical protein
VNCASRSWWERTADIYSLIGSAKLNGLDPEALLRNAPTRIKALCIASNEHAAASPLRTTTARTGDHSEMPEKTESPELQCGYCKGIGSRRMDSIHHPPGPQPDADPLGKTIKNLALPCALKSALGDHLKTGQ